MILQLFISALMLLFIPGLGQLEQRLDRLPLAPHTLGPIIYPTKYGPPSTTAYQRPTTAYPSPTTSSSTAYPRSQNPYPNPTYPYDPYEPYDPYDPYPFQYCELNDDEYGRPYYGPYDRYLRRTPQDSYRRGRHALPTTTTTLPPREIYAANLTRESGRKKRQVLTLPNCIVSKECNRKVERCTGYGTQYDSCNRRCTCRNGRLINCCRVRKEWHSLTQIERCHYVEVIRAVSIKQPWKRCYDQLIGLHRTHFSSMIHEKELFLPWHRWFILALENLLRQIDCTVTVPYWDWSMESQTWQNSIVWASQCGLGGDGSPVTTGPFRNGIWKLTPSANPGDPLRRRFRGSVPDCASVAMIQRQGVSGFDNWHDFVEVNLHSAVHCNIGGTMCSTDSANAPEFFLHHGFIDQIWATWQNKGPAFKNLPHYAQNDKQLPGAPDGYSPKDFYDLNNQPECVKVCIEPSSRPCRANTTYTPLCSREMNCYEYSPIKLADIIPRPYPTVPPEAYELFEIPYKVRRVSARYTQLFNSFDDLYEVLQTNGYHEGPVSYKPPQGEIQLERYLHQPSQPVYPSGTAPNGTLYPPPPPVCGPYISHQRG